jgi:hypothetical protein
VSKLIEALSFWVIDKGTGFDTQKRAEVSHFRHVLNLSQKRAFLILGLTGYFSRRKAPRFALNRQEPDTLALLGVPASQSRRAEFLVELCKQ